MKMKYDFRTETKCGGCPELISIYIYIFNVAN